MTQEEIRMVGELASINVKQSKRISELVHENTRLETHRTQAVIISAAVGLLIGFILKKE